MSRSLQKLDRGLREPNRGQLIYALGAALCHVSPLSLVNKQDTLWGVCQGGPELKEGPKIRRVSAWLRVYLSALGMHHVMSHL